MDQYSSNTSTIPSSSSTSPHLPLFLESLPFLSPSSLLPFDPSHPLLPPPPASPAPTRTSKKRSRASRRAPTTVLTTDTSNFRAMVQEFTGIPSPPFSSTSSSSSSSLLSLPTRSHHHFSPPFLIRPFSHKHQTTTTPDTLPIPPVLSSTSNTFLQSLINTQPVFAAKPPHPSPPAFAMAGREELQQSHQGTTLFDSWICSSDYK
ncbi:mucin-2-like [Dendrobium catenatum]|uniref:VQ domain-containing protein n=1 Tax=Dendrobium catenatum TaxID=906689 RepID=A0A2I0WFA2_9ASPA|nr:mucin-2-like [Dendrobium catenatum]PKU74354.1 hypothetical protein MA16_Dca003557 [Dendrobium catenatum]